MEFLYDGYILIVILRYYYPKSLTNIYLSIDSKRGRYLLYSSVLSGVLYGLKAEIVRVEVDVGNGIPSFEMSGFLSNEVKEARERVRVAIRNSGYELPPQRIVVNISPADIRKCGTGFDLPIALAILSANGYIDEVNVDNMIILGELSLDGFSMKAMAFCCSRHQDNNLLEGQAQFLCQYHAYIPDQELICHIQGVP